MNTPARASLPVIKRLPKYYRYLCSLQADGINSISSRELAAQMGTTASQVRQDFNCIGDVNGRQGIGYSVENLLSILEGLLFGNGDRLPTILIGAGRLGSAVSSFISRDNTVLVGANGKRFVDEKDSGYMTQKLNGPVFDQMHRDGLGYVWAISDQASLDEKGVKRGLDMEFVVADTFEELAEKMGLDAATLSETLTNYNAYCDAGHDPEFGRLKLAKLNAPYCAVRVTPCEIITYGGIARNENAEVIRADGAVIPGLYTAGEATASSAYMGFTISNAFTWGRTAGSGAAAFALAK